MPLVITTIPGILTIFCHVGLNLQFSSQQELCLCCRNLSRTAISTVSVVPNVLRTSTHCIHGEADTFTHDVGRALRNIRARLPHIVLQKHIASIEVTDCISHGLSKIWEHWQPCDTWLFLPDVSQNSFWRRSIEGCVLSPALIQRTAVIHVTFLVAFNSLEPRFNIRQFYVLPTQCIYVFCVDPRTHCDYFPTQH